MPALQQGLELEKGIRAWLRMPFSVFVGLQKEILR
jgi:hypothetical protein